MKSFIYILLTSLTFLVVGCQNESEEIRLINQAERLFDAYPDSVITTLDSIPLPEEMSPRLIARWCMLYARAADKIEDEMPYTNQLEIALKYYQKKKMREEEAEIGLYLGRSYVEDKEYEKAMRAYSDALEVALAIKNYNRAGYICSYMGDLYELDDRYVLAAKKYKESGRYFRLAGNMKSYVRSFVNEGRSYMDVDSNYLALTILKRAEVIIDSLRVDEVRDYLTLSDLEQKRGNLEQAENYLQKANSVSIDNDFVPATIAYHYYKINKERDDYKRALSFYEEYVAAEDSLMNISKSVDIYDTEQKYEHLKLHNENIRLLLKGQRNYTFILILLFLCALLIIVYLATIRRKNRSLLKQQEKINTLNQSIYQLYAELRRKSDELIQLQNTQYSSVKMQVEYENVQKEVDSLRSRLFELRESKILNSNLAKKIKKISQTVQPNHSEAPVSEKMWIDIEVLMMEVYPSVIKVLKDAGLSPSEMHLCFLTLFKLDSTAISILLNIIPTSVDRTRLRVRKKLNWEGKQGLYESLVNI